MIPFFPKIAWMSSILFPAIVMFPTTTFVIRLLVSTPRITTGGSTHSPCDAFPVKMTVSPLPFRSNISSGLSKKLPCTKNPWNSGLIDPEPACPDPQLKTPGLPPSAVQSYPSNANTLSLTRNPLCVNWNVSFPVAPPVVAPEPTSYPGASVFPLNLYSYEIRERLAALREGLDTPAVRAFYGAAPTVEAIAERALLLGLAALEGGDAR